MDRDVRWFAMPIGMQISNIGSEVGRAIKWQNRHDKAKAVSFCDKAIELLQLTKKDKKNKFRQGELDFCIEELKDYFEGDNIYNTTDTKLMKYYDAFIK
jgi:hypothetical protein